jgi:hypothetical protein
LFPSEYNVITANDLVELDSDPLDDYYQPLPLTEEWLLRMGFEYEQDEKAFCITNELGVKYGVCKFENNWSLILYSLDDWQVATHIKFVHELQNLYWCLCGEELKINLH